MDTKTLFNSYSYFEGLCRENLLAKKHDFQFCRCAGLNGLQEAIDKFQTAGAFFCIDDTTDGTTFERNGGYFQRRVFTVFLLKNYLYDDMEDRMSSLTVCRTLYAQLYSRMLVDSDRLTNDLIYLNTDRVHFREIENYFLNGCTGLYFMIDVDEPLNLAYDETEWEK